MVALFFLNMPMIPLFSRLSLGTMTPSADLVGQFLTWCKDNKMVCNPCKCKELVVRKKNHNVLYSPINNIHQCNSFVLLGVTLQSDGQFKP